MRALKGHGAKRREWAAWEGSQGRGQIYKNLQATRNPVVEEADNVKPGSAFAEPGFKASGPFDMIAAKADGCFGQFLCGVYNGYGEI